MGTIHSTKISRNHSVRTVNGSVRSNCFGKWGPPFWLGRSDRKFLFHFIWSGIWLWCASPDRLTRMKCQMKQEFLNWNEKCHSSDPNVHDQSNFSPNALCWCELPLRAGVWRADTFLSHRDDKVQLLSFSAEFLVILKARQEDVRGRWKDYLHTEVQMKRKQFSSASRRNSRVTSLERAWLQRNGANDGSKLSGLTLIFYRQPVL